MTEKEQLADIEKQLQSLYLQKEVLQNSIKAASLGKFFELIAQCEFQVTDSYVFVLPSASIEKEFDRVVHEHGEGWNHFEFPLSGRIMFRGDDGRFQIQYNPNIEFADKKALEHECSNENGINSVIAFLKSRGVQREKFITSRLTREVVEKEKNLNKAKSALERIQKLIDL